MKRMLTFLTLAATLAAATLWANGCGRRTPTSPTATSETSPAATGKPAGEAAKEGKAAYACPMHPEITSDKPGKCSICGMNLAKKAKTSAVPAQGEKVAYVCPCAKCGSVRSDRPGVCPKCGMDLVPEKA